MADESDKAGKPKPRRTGQRREEGEREMKKKKKSRTSLKWLHFWTCAPKWHIKPTARSLGIQFDDDETVSVREGRKIRLYYNESSFSTTGEAHTTDRANFVQGGLPESKRR